MLTDVPSSNHRQRKNISRLNERTVTHGQVIAVPILYFRTFPKISVFSTIASVAK